MTTTSLTRTTGADLDALARQSKVLASAGWWGKDPMVVAAQILVGRDLGLSDTRALTDIHVVKGRPVIGYAALGALVKRSGRYTYRLVHLDDERCEIEWFELFGAARESIGRSSFSVEEAKVAGLLKNPTWAAYRQDMLFARAMSRGVRRFAPDVVGGAVYVPGELDDEPARGSEVIEASVVDEVRVHRYDPDVERRREAAIVELDRLVEGRDDRQAAAIWAAVERRVGGEVNDADPDAVAGAVQALERWLERDTEDRLIALVAKADEARP